ncbi:MAG: hypothetical protein IKA71_06185 [Lentisphaeria bacterium]|nr:hypothetical protein [Lentisphaeria bacterium]
MSVTEKQRGLYSAIKEKISRTVRFPLRLTDTAQRLGIPLRELYDTLWQMYRKKLLDREIDIRVQLQPILDKKYVNAAHLVSAPLLTPEEVLRGEYIPGDGQRHFATLALPREFAGETGRYCSFQVSDNVMEKRRIYKGDIAICSIGQMPRHGAPVLCVMPGGEVCIRSFYTTNTPFFELSTPDHEEAVMLSYYSDWHRVVGVVISVQKFILAWEGASMKHISEPLEDNGW